jgi:hypothetical protein
LAHDRRTKLQTVKKKYALQSLISIAKKFHHRDFQTFNLCWIYLTFDFTVKSMGRAQLDFFEVARLAKWLERQRKDHQILKLRVRIPLCDMSAGLSDETV